MTARLLAGLTAIALTSAGLIAGATAAQADTGTVSVDLSTVTGPVQHVGQGWLYGLSQDGLAPSDSILAPLAPTSFRSGGALQTSTGRGYTFGQLAPRYNMVKAQAQRVTAAPYNATFDVLLSDLWGSDGFPDRPSPITEPCDDSTSCPQWVSFLTQVVNQLSADGLLNSKVRFDIWNEPGEPGVGNIFWPRSQAQYYNMWNVGVATLRSLYPAAVIVGPSEDHYDSTQIGAWLDQAKAASTLPNVLNWHFSNDPVADATDARSLLAARSITGISLSINEYLWPSQQTAGYTAWYLSRLQKSGISSASHAIWANCCIDGSLDQILVPAGSALVPTGQYWTYRAGADQSGSQVSTTGTSTVDLTASRDDSASKASIFLGGNSTFTGTLTTQISGLSATPYLVKNGLVRVVLTRIPDGALSQPIVVSNSLEATTSGQLNVTVPWTAATDAYEITLEPGNPDTSAVDGNVTTGTNHFSYGSGWGLTTGVSDMYANTANYSFTSGATATFTFYGTNVELYAAKAADQAIMTVSLDGGTPVSIDNYSATRNASALAWTSPTVGLGTHTLTIVNTGTKNPASSGINIAIDRADVPQPLYPIDGNTLGTDVGQFNYGTGWGLTAGVSDMYNGTANRSFTAGATATFSFYGNQIAFYAAKANDQGIMSLSLDGGTAINIDNYSATRDASALAWTSPRLAIGTHTLTIVNTGTKNPASGGLNIAIDRADIRQPLPTDGSATAGVNHFTYGANWGQTNVGDMFQTTANYSFTSGDAATFAFSGTQIAIYAAKANDQGIMSLSIDGATPVTVDNYAATRNASALAYTSPTLAAGNHTLTIVNTGTKNSSSTGINIAVDRIDVASP